MAGFVKRKLELRSDDYVYCTWMNYLTQKQTIDTKFVVFLFFFYLLLLLSSSLSLLFLLFFNVKAEIRHQNCLIEKRDFHSRCRELRPNYFGRWTKKFLCVIHYII